MKRYIRSSDSKLPHYSELFDRIDAIIITPDIDISYDKYPIRITASTDTDLLNFAAMSKRDLAHLVKTRPAMVKKITDYHALVNLMDLVKDFNLSYEFTEEQLTILDESFAGRSLFKDDSPNPNSATSPVTLPISMYDIERILDMLRKCTSVAEPDIRDVLGKNFAECHDYIMDKYDYLGIIKQILGSEVISKSRSYMHSPRSHYMNYIFEFMHPGNNYALRSGQVVDEYIDIYIKLVFDYAKDYVVAVVSFHEPERHKKLAKAAFPDYEKINPAVKTIANTVTSNLTAYFADVVIEGDIKVSFRLNTCGLCDNDTTIFIEVLDPFDDKVSASTRILPEYDLSECSAHYVTTLCNTLISEYKELLADNG